jgi:hypothetical protein
LHEIASAPQSAPFSKPASRNLISLRSFGIGKIIASDNDPANSRAVPPLEEALNPYRTPTPANGRDDTRPDPKIAGMAQQLASRP